MGQVSDGGFCEIGSHISKINCIKPINKTLLGPNDNNESNLSIYAQLIIKKKTYPQ